MSDPSAERVVQAAIHALRGSFAVHLLHVSPTADVPEAARLLAEVGQRQADAADDLAAELLDRQGFVDPTPPPSRFGDLHYLAVSHLVNRWPPEHDRLCQALSECAALLPTDDPAQPLLAGLADRTRHDAAAIADAQRAVASYRQRQPRPKAKSN